MTRLLILAVLSLSVLAGELRAQAGSLRLHDGEQAAEAALAMHRGHPAHPARMLEAFGARVQVDSDGARIVLFGDTLEFQHESPFFSVGSQVWPLASPAYREGSVLYLPRQFFTEWLPARHGQRLSFADGVLRLAANVAEAPEPTASERENASAAREPAANEPAARTPSPAQRARADWTRNQSAVRVVILDPGHGGRDPGKTGPTGVREKDVVLDIAKRVAAELESRGGYEIHLTRTTDTLPSLADRPRMANEWKAGRPSALFVSIHANAHHTQARGFETFFLSEARTEDERRVAEMENAAIAYEDPERAVPADDLDWILNNLRNDFYLRASHDLAAVIQNRMGAIHPGPNRGVKQAGFRVLVGAFMPAVLVETAFITHREEERLLRSGSFQQRIAVALADAIDEFFDEHEHLWLTASGN